MIELDADQKTPLYEQLYAALADEIRTGQRAPGTPLPGRRTMAAQQGRQRQHGGRRLPDAGRRGSGRAAPPQRLLCAKDLRHAAQPRPPCPPPPLYRSRPPRRSRSTTCPPAAWTRRCSRRAAGDASRRSCSTSGPSFYSAAKCRATPRCAHRSRNICRCTAVWNARRSRSSSARALSICSGAWRTCSATAWRPSRTPAISARGRSCRTAAFPARWWTLTARACPPTRWKKAAQTSAI